MTLVDSRSVEIRKDELFSNSPFVGPEVPNEQALRRQALADIDNVPVGTSHVRAVIVASMGFFTDAYDLFSANFITTMIGRAYAKSNTIPTQADTAIKLSATAGAVIGQVLF